VAHRGRKLPRYWPGGRLDTEFIDQCLPGVLVGGQRIGPPARPVKGDHELGPEPLAERIVRGQLPQVASQLGVAAQVQPGFDPGFLGLQSHLSQPRSLPPQQQW
jgi:hypothetical protein